MALWRHLSHTCFIIKERNCLSQNAISLHTLGSLKAEKQLHIRHTNASMA